MISVDIKIDNKITPALQGMKQALANYPKQAEAKFKSLTPIKSGNARRRTNLSNADTIEANYA